MDLDAEFLEATESRGAVLAGGKIGYLGVADRDRREHSGSVRNGFVAGNLHPAVEFAGSTDLHNDILNRGAAFVLTASLVTL
jgi:hypothetical protein